MHGGWCWERVAPLLAQHGHAVFAPDLPGLGADRTPAADVTLEGWGRFIADITSTIPGQVILVGHSLGGAAISQAAECAPDRIAVLVYLAAVMLRSGQSTADLPQESSALTLTLSPDGQYVTVDPQTARAAFYGETSDEWSRRALQQLVAQPAAILREKLNLTAARFGTVKRVYINCLRDQGNHADRPTRDASGHVLRHDP